MFARLFVVFVMVAGVASAQKQGLPPFPSDRAEWVVRGKARVDRYVPARMIEFTDGEDPISVPAARYRCNAIDLTLPNVVVIVQGLERRWRFPRPAERLDVAVTPKGFVPHAVCVVAGQRIQLRNGLDTAVRLRYANLTPRPLDGLAGMLIGRGRAGFRAPLQLCREAPKEIERIRAGATAEARFHVPEKAQLQAVRDTADSRTKRCCPVWVLPHPIFVVTDEAGRFALPRLPNGKYEIVAEHEVFGIVRQTIEIAGTRPKPVTFVFAARGHDRVTPSKTESEELQAKIRFVEWRLRRLQGRRFKDRDRVELNERLTKLQAELAALQRR